MGGGGGSVSDPPSVSSVYNFVTNLFNPALTPTTVSRSIVDTLEDWVPQWDTADGVLKLGKFIYLSVADALLESNGNGLLDSRTIACFLESIRIVLGLDEDGKFTDPSTGTGSFECSCFRSQDVNEEQTITSLEPAFTDNNPSWPTPGFTFQFEFDGIQSSVVQSDEDIIAIQAALETIPALTGNISVSAVAVAPNPVWSPGGTEVVTVEFINALANTNVPLISIVNYAKEPSAPPTLTEPAFVVAQTVEGHKTTWVEAFCCLHDKHDQLRIDHDNLQLEVDRVEAAVCLNTDGTLPDVSGEDEFINSETCILDMIKSLANNLRCAWDSIINVHNRLVAVENDVFILKTAPSNEGTILAHATFGPSGNIIVASDNVGSIVFSGGNYIVTMSEPLPTANYGVFCGGEHPAGAFDRDRTEVLQKRAGVPTTIWGFTLTNASTFSNPNFAVRTQGSFVLIG
jgi:hypothetical protein